jgi:hypothetical protein
MHPIEEFLESVKDKGAITRHLLWMEKQGAVVLKWYGDKPDAAIDYIIKDKYEHANDVWNTWQYYVSQSKKVTI